MHYKMLAVAGILTIIVLATSCFVYFHCLRRRGHFVRFLFAMVSATAFFICCGTGSSVFVHPFLFGRRRRWSTIATPLAVFWLSIYLLGHWHLVHICLPWRFVQFVATAWTKVSSSLFLPGRLQSSGLPSLVCRRLALGAILVHPYLFVLALTTFGFLVRPFSFAVVSAAVCRGGEVLVFPFLFATALAAFRFINNCLRRRWHIILDRPFSFTRTSAMFG
jgi:hypothetical protein